MPFQLYPQLPAGASNQGMVKDDLFASLLAERAPGMTDEQVGDFVARYMPAYKAYLPGLYEAAAADGVFGKPTLLARVDEARAPV